MQGWCITKDHFSDEGDSRVGIGQVNKETVFDEAEQWFGRTITVESDLSKAVIENPIPFKLFGDDGDLAYSGFISESWLNGEECLAFAPLRYGECDYGCTYMEYKWKNEWKVL